MAKFDPPQGPSFDLDRLVATLNDSRIQEKNPPLYQVIFRLLRAVQAFQKLASTNINNNSGGISDLKDRTYLTVADETVFLPSSRQELAGTNITFDDSVAGRRTISSSPPAGYWTLLTDGDVDETDFIFANGDPISIFVPL
jgi:hypothetical protein